jgi:hypothetical protein
MGKPENRIAALELLIPIVRHRLTDLRVAILPASSSQVQGAQPA